ncbi:uncharacterized protein JN550_010866 [Neoarthrinium moseri]|uniref:uncharacterized protein n=1 Tax=Neoarthrinium moseri TaxID=1658444 RepID=UPI001FDB79EA|nr:uncharacterized protein JN550_010866 [Neoarthrinium moseri]KAI1861336.1 hypothetical protein JN550_010866 [Neoarthrinium moseri]
MSLYYETAEVLSLPASTGGSLKSRVFGKKDHKTAPQQIYALAAETCKWSSVLKEVIENADILRLERKLTPVLALLLVHDLLLSKGGIALPASHGLRASIERHKARLASELTRARIKRKAASIDALRQQVEAESAKSTPQHPRWVRVNALLSSLEEQLESTFKAFERVYAIGDVTLTSKNSLYIDEHVPNLIAITPSFQIIKTNAYKTGAIILQDKASCFPAYLLDPHVEDGDIIDSCAAPGNKTTHLASIISSHTPETDGRPPKVFAFERNPHRAKTLESMVKLAGGNKIIHVTPRQDFLKVDPQHKLYKNVGCLLLDPSCSGSGIVGREVLPIIHLPEAKDSVAPRPKNKEDRKRKRAPDDTAEPEARVLIDDDGQQTVVSSEQELQARLDTLSSFQLMLLEHAFKFPAAKRITYSTCSIHSQENEQVVMKALHSNVARARGWRILTRDRQVRGMKEWPVRGTIDGADGDRTIADACIRSYNNDGMGVMGFFVAAFVRETPEGMVDDEGPYLRDEQGCIVRDVLGMPQSKANETSQRSTATCDNSVADGDGSESDSEEWDGFAD